MIDINLSRVGELLRSVFELLWVKPDGLPSRDIFSLIPKITQLTEYEMEYSLTTWKAPRYERIIRMATIPIFRAGWLARNNKGRWYITDNGRQACNRIPNGQELYKEACQLFDEYKQSAIDIIITTEMAEEITWEKIQEYLLAMNLTDFRNLVADLITAMGYYVTWVAPPEKDRGRFDIVAHSDLTGSKGGQVLVCIKHKGQAITAEGIKNTLASLNPGSYNLVISTSGFTAEARDELQNHSSDKLTVWDLETFFNLWVMHLDKLSNEAKQRLPLKVVYALWPLE
jgi:restriction system protein